MTISAIELPDFSGAAVGESESIPERLRELSQDAGSSVALKCDGIEITWAGACRDAARIANRLIDQGFETDARVGLLARNSNEYLTTLLGIVSAAYCAVPLATMIAADSVAKMIRDSNASALFVSEDYAAIAESVAASVEGLRHDRVIGLGFETTGIKSVAGWVDAAADTLPELEIDPASPFNIIYSSRTTGIPKGTVQSHRARAVMAAGLQPLGLDAASVCLIGTALYTNLSLAAFFGAFWAG